MPPYREGVRQPRPRGGYRRHRDDLPHRYARHRQAHRVVQRQLVGVGPQRVEYKQILLVAGIRRGYLQRDVVITARKAMQEARQRQRPGRGPHCGARREHSPRQVEAQLIRIQNVHAIGHELRERVEGVTRLEHLVGGTVAGDAVHGVRIGFPAGRGQRLGCPTVEEAHQFFAYRTHK